MTKYNDSEIHKLREQVDNLTRLVGVLSKAFDKMSQSQAVVSDTVNDLVEAQAQLTIVQDQLLKALSDNNTRMDEIGDGVKEMLKRLP